MQAQTSSAFPVIDVPRDAAQAPEAMGSKFKFWYRDQDQGQWLYKQARPDTGEDWAEKVAAEIAGRLDLPHARVELAKWGDTRGIVTSSFVPEMAVLVHGNELLTHLLSDYPHNGPRSRSFHRVRQHTVKAVFDAISLPKPSVLVPLNWQPPAGIRRAGDVFVGYLLLDAWIGNTDRHHENWGLVIKPSASGHDPSAAVPPTVHLAPTFDHASSLGRNETDDRRRQRLVTRDEGNSVRAYVEKARSALYAQEGDKRPLTTLEAFRKGASICPEAARIWLDRLESVPEDSAGDLLRRVPSERVSPLGVEFAETVLRLNRKRLLDLREDLC